MKIFKKWEVPISVYQKNIKIDKNKSVLKLNFTSDKKKSHRNQSIGLNKKSFFDWTAPLSGPIQF